MSRLRDEIKAIAAIGGLLAVFITVSYFNYGGKVELIAGTIVRFGSYASDDGNQPTVIVRTNGDDPREIPANRALLQGCRVGGQITLAKRAHSVTVAPRGCR